MKNFYRKHNNCSEDDRPIPEPDEQLFNNPDENERQNFEGKVRFLSKSQKNKKA
ncbi:MAG: hypothetical protein J6K12_00940 [Clostridia bacterium]|nr:hypothetical protein [Clostridia bacterium]